MAVQIRLARYGSKKAPYYRVVVTDRRNSRDGRFIETIGTLSTLSEPIAFQLDRERLEYWRARGARPSATLERLLKKRDKASEGA